MGIKGIYQELGPGKRVSLAKLAADSFESSSRPFRLAIDIAIWQFQNQAARGGTNPAIRTLFYRLVRLLGTPIQPIFVFDGPDKPKLKRNKRSGRGDGVATAQAKRLIRLFGFVAHDAPGEAEAECALLQKNHIVDAVLSEDVDTIMFGCTRTLRNWSAESKSSKTPTHVSMYDVKDDLGLDREGMVLVALMSGGDYHPEGIPGCGPKVACEAARAGFGKSICRLKASDTEGLRSWRASLAHELKTNESKFFRTRHKALDIPGDFPNLEVLRYYTHPKVSPESSLDGIKQKLAQTRDIQLEALREFTRETFDWDFRFGAIKFIRVLGEALLVQNLCQNKTLAGNGMEPIIKRISGRRQHFSTDGTSELRLAYVPEDVVPIDISTEVDEIIPSARDGLALNSDDEYEAAAGGDAAVATKSIKVFDITKPDLTWVLEDVVKKFAPDILQKWEDQTKDKPKSPAKKKSGKSKSKKMETKSQGSLDSFVRVTKAPQVLEPSSTKRTKELDADISLEPPNLPPKTNSFRRPQTPPSLRDPSKLSSPRGANSSDDWINLQESPRLPHHIGGHETIVIPSSPLDKTALPAPVPPSPSPIRASATVSQEIPSSIRSILTASSKSKGMNKSPTKATASKMTVSKFCQGTKFKQTSLDMYNKQATDSRSNKPSSRKSDEIESTKHSIIEPTTSATFEDSDVEIISSTPNSPTLSNKQIQQPTNNSNHSSSPTSVQTKKLLVPGVSAAGFFDEIEVDADEYEERVAQESQLLKTLGIIPRVARWSDISVIDLTGEN